MLRLKRLVTICLLCTCWSAYAQQMQIKDFKLLDRDLTANSGATKRISPQDGNVAALIKVVTTETGFNFDGGSYALVGNPVYNPGEIWIYVPARAQKLTISHSRFGVLRDYYYPVPIEAGRTYEMLLDPGVGKFVTIQTSTPRATVYLDGDSIGVAPLYNYYTLYGKHKLYAVNDKMDGELEIYITTGNGNAAESVTIPMSDQSSHFGQVVITTDPDAEILFNGEVKGVGTWRTDLREGSYVVETRKVNCDNSKTSFSVRPQTTNTVQALPPIPHKGLLHLFTRPKDVALALNGHPIANIESLELPVGIQTLTFSRKDYYTLEKEYDIQRHTTISDTINLRRIQYLKDKGFYFGASCAVGQFLGATGLIGLTYANIDLQASYTFGLSNSKEVNFYDTYDNTFLSKNTYTLNTLAIKLGYQVALATRFGIIPQIGFALHQLKGKALEGSDSPGDGSMCNCLSLGGKFIYSPVHHFCIFAAPEYDVAVSKDKNFEAVAKIANFSEGGFVCNIGIIVNF